MDGNRSVTAIVAPASMASPPMPFLLRDMSDAIGQLVVIPDDKMGEVIAMLQKRHDLQLIETDQGSFIYLPNSDVKDGIFELRSTE